MVGEDQNASKPDPRFSLQPENLSEDRARKTGVSAGWWAVDKIGTPVLGPYPSHEAVLLAIARERDGGATLPP